MNDKIVMFNEVSKMIFETKRHFYTTLNELYQWNINPSSSEEWTYIYKACIRNYLNIFEYACMMYQEDLIDRRLFNKMFISDIISIYESDFGAKADLHIQDESTPVFEYIRQVYKESK